MNSKNQQTRPVKYIDAVTKKIGSPENQAIKDNL